jgi:TonB family protein
LTPSRLSKSKASSTADDRIGRHPLRMPRLSHSPIAATLDVALRATALLCLSSALPVAHAQSAPCGLTSIQESTQLSYPPIAKAAHVQGSVVLLATFDRDGTVSRVKIVSAPLLLDRLMGRVAADFVKGWKANAFSGPRECPVSITFSLGPDNDHPKTFITRSDLQHVLVTSENYPPTVMYSVASK